MVMFKVMVMVMVMVIKSPARVSDTCHAEVAEVGGGGGRLQVASCDWGFLIKLLMMMIM